MDLMGPFPETTRGNKHVLMVVDPFTKWFEAFPVPNMEAETVAKVAVREIICRFGTPWALHSDQGRTFESRVMVEVARGLGMEKMCTTPYNPQADRQVERFNRTLGAMLTAVVAPDWDGHLPLLTAAYRATAHPATGFSPNFMTFGRQITLPVEVMYGVPPEEEVTVSGNYQAEVLRKLLSAFQEAYCRQGRVADRQKQYYDRTVRAQSYGEGDRVWLFSPAQKVGRCPKLQRWWTGPWTVWEVLSPVLFRISWGHRKKVVHGDLLKMASLPVVPTLRVECMTAEHTDRVPVARREKVGGVYPRREVTGETFQMDGHQDHVVQQWQLRKHSNEAPSGVGLLWEDASVCVHNRWLLSGGWEGNTHRKCHPCY